MSGSDTLVSVDDLSNGFTARALGLRARVRSYPGGYVAWRVAVAALGAVFVLGGLVLVPLPGPGWLIVFLGLGIWGTEFAWANRLLTWVRATVSEATAWIGRQPAWLRVAGSVVTVIVVVAIVGLYLAWQGWWPFSSTES